MADKLKLSGESTEKLNYLSSNLRLRRNTICRIALGLSLSLENPPDITSADQNGAEFNRSTIMGTDDSIFLAMSSQQAGEEIDSENFFNITVKSHITRGVKLLFETYEKINSPFEFFQMLCGGTEEFFIENDRP